MKQKDLDFNVAAGAAIVSVLNAVFEQGKAAQRLMDANVVYEQRTAEAANVINQLTALVERKPRKDLH